MVDDGHTNKDKDEREDDYDICMPPAVNTMVDDGRRIQQWLLNDR